MCKGKKLLVYFGPYCSPSGVNNKAVTLIGTNSDYHTHREDLRDEDSSLQIMMKQPISIKKLLKTFAFIFYNKK